MALLTTPAAREAARLKYQPDSKYRHKRVAIPSATDTYGDTEADHAKYQNKRARVEDGSGPNERMFAAFLEASRTQHQQEIASLEAQNHQKQVEVANLKSECDLRVSSSDQACQQAIESVIQQAAAEMKVKESQCEQRVLAKCEKEHTRLIDIEEQKVEAQAEEIKALKNQILELQQGGHQLWARNQCLAQENSQLATDNAGLSQELEDSKIRLAQQSQELTDENIALSETLDEQLDENKKAQDRIDELESEVLVEKSNVEELNKANLQMKKLYKKTNSAYNTLKEDAESGVYEMSSTFQNSNLKTKEKRRPMPAEMRKDEKMKAARSKSGSAAPKGIQKTKGINKKASKKAIADDSDNEDEDSLVNKLAGAANNSDSESFDYARRSGRGLDATFGIVTPPDSADSSMVE